VNTVRSASLCFYILFGLLLVSCRKHANENPDAALQRKLTGTWVLTYTPASSNFQNRTIVNPDGGYIAHCRQENSNGVRTFDIQGTYRITNGWLVDTIIDETQVTNKSALPVMSTNQIVKLTDSDLIINYGTTNEPMNGTFRKEGK
jgi:hypothetical protein